MQVNRDKIPSLERLKELLDYNPETGIFKWKVYRSRTAKKGWAAGCLRPDGYIAIIMDRVSFYAHRLAIYYVDEYWPENDIDHINRIKNDNKRKNLREVSRSCNMRNKELQKSNKTGVAGVQGCWNRGYAATIRYNGKQQYLGCFRLKEEAVRVRYKAEQEINWTICGRTSSAEKWLSERFRNPSSKLRRRRV